ncbi:MAG: sugar MFS transporter [Bacteroidota bacterium]
MADTTTDYRSALYTMFSLFFMWGFITCMNDILIPYLKEVFTLNYTQAMLVQFAFFGAYTIGSLIYFLFSLSGIDPIERVGYKNGILVGLVISALSCALFYPAAEYQIYGYFLGALFLLGIGFTILQIAANPYVAILGPASTASSRLNLAQGFNSFGTTIAPLIGGYLVFEFFAGPGGELSAESVKTPYLIFAGLFVVLGIFIALSKLPAIQNDEKIEAGLGALKYPFLILGGVAIFAYVGGEVTVGSTLINYLELPEVAGMEKSKADIFLAFYWGGAMIGRFTGAVSLGKKMTPKLLLTMIGVALGFFAVVFLAARLKSEGTLTLTEMLPFLIFVGLNLIGFVIGRSLPARTLGVFAGINVLMLIIAINSSGAVAMWTVIGMGLFNSIMWSNIFTLAIEGLGKYTSQGSSVLVMMILGGALVPLIQGAVADGTGDLQFSMIVPIFCYLYLVFYGLKGANIGKPKVEA